MKRIAITAIFAVLFSATIFPQSVKYNGEAEVGVVTTGKFATAQINLATTHGAYFTKPGLFVGTGAALGFNIDAEFYNRIYPVYADIRKDFSISRPLTLFIDAKVGYSFSGGDTGVLSDSGVTYGFYSFPSAGIRFAISECYGVYLRAGYTYQRATLEYEFGVNKTWIKGSHTYNTGGFSAAIGFSF